MKRHPASEAIVNHYRVYVTIILLFIIALAMAGCAGGSTIEFIPAGGTYTLGDAEAEARSIDISALEKVTVDEIGTLRQERLADLRGFGEDAALVADTLTRDFPIDSLSVPIRVEAADLDGQEVWLIFEAWAEEGGTLSHKRLWILDRDTRALVDSMSFR